MWDGGGLFFVDWKKFWENYSFIPASHPPQYTSPYDPYIYVGICCIQICDLKDITPINLVLWDYNFIYLVFFVVWSVIKTHHMCVCVYVCM